MDEYSLLDSHDFSCQSKIKVLTEFSLRHTDTNACMCVHEHTHMYVHTPSDWCCPFVSIDGVPVTAPSRSKTVFRRFSAVTATPAPAHVTSLLNEGQVEGPDKPIVPTTDSPSGCTILKLLIFPLCCERPDHISHHAVWSGAYNLESNLYRS